MSVYEYFGLTTAEREAYELYLETLQTYFGA